MTATNTYKDQNKEMSCKNSSDKKCIWYISKYVCPDGYDGTGTRGFSIMKNFSIHNYESVIISSDSNHCIKPPVFSSYSFVENIKGVNFHWLKTYKYKKTNSIKRILSWIDFEIKLFFYNKKDITKPDAIIISSLSLFTIINGIFLKRKYNAKLIFEIRDIWPLTLIEEGNFSKYNPLIVLLGFIEKLGYKFSDIIIGTMPNLTEHVNNLGIDGQAFCIPMGIDEEKINDKIPLEEHFFNKYIPANKFIIAHLGSVGITNALDHFLDCAESLRDYKDIHFLVVGVGDLLENFKTKYDDYENITFAPRVEKKMVLSLLEFCDVAYFYSYESEVWKYGQSLNKVIDYMYSGTPIIASYSGYPSMINESQCGVFIDQKDLKILKESILNFYKMDKKDLKNMGLSGKEWLTENRKYEKLASEYLDIIFK